VKYPDFAICNEVCPVQWRVAGTPPENLLEMKTPNVVTIAKKEEGNDTDCDQTFQASCSSSGPHLLTQWNLNDFVRDLNLSKNNSRTIRFRAKRVEYSIQSYWNIFISKSSKWIQRIFLSRNHLVFFLWCLLSYVGSWAPTRSNSMAFNFDRGHPVALLQY
jgi:hypothetical protein